MLSEIRAVRRDLPALISSGYNETEAMNRVTAGKVAGFLQKPYTAAQLTASVQMALAETPVHD